MSDAQPATIDAAVLAERAGAGLLPGFVVDARSARRGRQSQRPPKTKGLETSPVAGEADLILFPNIESANATGRRGSCTAAARTEVSSWAPRPRLAELAVARAERRVLGLLLAQTLIAGREVLL